MGIQMKLLMASHRLVRLPISSIPFGVFMNVSQALAMNMIAVPTRLSMTPRNMCTRGENLPHP